MNHTVLQLLKRFPAFLTKIGGRKKKNLLTCDNYELPPYKFLWYQHDSDISNLPSLRTLPKQLRVYFENNNHSKGQLFLRNQLPGLRKLWQLLATLIPQTIVCHLFHIHNKRLEKGRSVVCN
jgi:hypothetical protein